MKLLASLIVAGLVIYMAVAANRMFDRVQAETAARFDAILEVK